MTVSRSPFHRGEQALQSRLGIRDRMEQLGRRVIRDHMPEQHREFFARLPTMLIGSADASGRPWASVLAGGPGFVQAVEARALRITARPIYGDPLNEGLVEGADVGILGLESHTRRRNRVNGRIVRVEEDGFEIRVTQSFGNCPKYIQAREVETRDAIATIGERRTVRRGEALSKAEAALIARSDTLFIASQCSEGDTDWAQGVDVSHRGGRPGFVVVAHETSLLFPDYSGNCMFNTLGNILVNPRCGLLFIDYDTGDTLQVTGEAEILWESHHTQRFPGAQRVVSFRVEETRHIAEALPLSWVFKDYSPVFDEFEPGDDRPSTEEKPATMKLLSVNLSTPKEITHAGKTVTTGIFKRPTTERVVLRTLNLDATREALSIPALSHGWKGSFEERLTKAQEAGKTPHGFRRFVVERKVRESESITSFYLAPEDGAELPEFLPGQFLTFKLDIPGQTEPVIRTYSLSDGPGAEHYRVSVKREPPPGDQPDAPPGVSSSYFHDHVEVGTTLEVGPPRGKFHLDLDNERSVVLLSGGVGLTPMISMLNTIVRRDRKRPTWFIHGTRHGREHAMGEHLRRVVRERDNVHAHFCYSEPDPGDVEGRDYDSMGRVDIALLKRVLPYDDYEFYLCGPPPFMRSLYCGLSSLRVSKARIHYEFFGPASAMTQEAAPCGPAVTRTGEEEVAGELQVDFTRSGVRATWDPACETILDLAEKHGLSPDYSCRSGICHTCTCTLVEGEVEYLEEPLDPPDPGQVLICCARPRTRVVVDA